MDTNTTCSICLEDIDDTHLPITLTCNHTFHFTCFKTYVFKTKHTFFIDCPLCRELNYRIEYPFKNNFKKNVKVLCSLNVGKVRCSEMTLQGFKCKKKSHVLNYGKCQFHNKDILPNDKYEQLCIYMYHILQCTNRSWGTKVYLIDFVKKLLIKYGDDIHTLDDIYRYFFVFIADAKKKNITDYYKDKSILYDYYSLELPDSLWVDFCTDKRCLF